MCRLLIVDDHTVVRHWLKQWLGDLFPDWEFEEAENGRIGVEMALLHEPDAVLMDISMPVMDGLEATELISQSVGSVPVIVMTLHTAPEYRDRAYEAGAAGFVRKDRVDDELIPMLEAVMGEKQSLNGV